MVESRAPEVERVVKRQTISLSRAVGTGPSPVCGATRNTWTTDVCVRVSLAHRPPTEADGSAMVSDEDYGNDDDDDDGIEVLFSVE